MWKERNNRGFEGVEEVDGYDLIKNKLFQTLGLLMGHSINSSTELENLLDSVIDL